ncbi:Hsp70 ATPase ssc1 [Quaeritorhiza haematococci]|nr:Hsp70 ATPase ssc1 [Quaeritorhiza haematococci]
MTSEPTTNSDFFSTVLATPLLILSTFLARSFFSILQAPTLVAEILIGLLFSPHVLNLFPHTSAILSIGSLGLSLLVFEGGISLDIHQIKKVGWKAGLVAVTGVGLPVLAGFSVVGVGLGYGTVGGVVSGTSMASTSIGMASRMLTERGMMRSFVGGLVMVAAMVDDILSLVLLAVVVQLGRNEDAPEGSSGSSASFIWNVMRPVVMSFVCAIIGFVVFHGLKWFRYRLSFWNAFSSHPSMKNVNAMMSTPNALLVCMAITTITSALLAHVLGTTHLLGIFTSGVIWRSMISPVSHNHHSDDADDGDTVKDHATSAYESIQLPVQWLHSLFFVSIGYIIPIATMFRPSIFAWGCVYSVVAIVTKLVTGLWVFAPPHPPHPSPHQHQSHLNITSNTKSSTLLTLQAILVGFCMTARGELGYLIAAEGKTAGVLDDEALGITVWALTVSTFVAPFFVAVVLERLVRTEKKAEESGVGVGSEEDGADCDDANL